MNAPTATEVLHGLAATREADQAQRLNSALTAAKEASR